MYYSLIDKEANNGHGALIEKNMLLMSGKVLREGGMTACKHANGRDYWLVVGGSVINRYYKFLITPEGVTGPFIQHIGPGFRDNLDIAYSKFSQDGSKYATGIYAYAPIVVMDFDRCSGLFSNPDTIFNHIYGDTASVSGSSSLEFSPNNRFLYTTFHDVLIQYDLQNPDIYDTSILYKAGANEFYGIHMLQLSPNGKLYASTWGGGLKALHVINNPDLKGDSAAFVYAAQPTYTINSINLPNLINYRLGPLYASGCDTITDIKQQTANNQLLRIMPNPADKYAYVEVSAQGNYEFELLTESGQIIDKKGTKQVDIFDTERLANGVYVVRVIDKASGIEIITKKVVVAH